MKRLICLCLAFVLMVSAIPRIHAAETEPLSGTCGTDATWSLSDGVLTIEGSGLVNAALSTSPWREYSNQIHTVIVGEGITELSSYCFMEFTILQSVILPDSLTTIGQQAFQSCNMLTEITLPKNLKSIGTKLSGVADALSCKSLQAIYVHEENTYFTAADGVLYDKAMQTLLCYPQGKNDDSYIVPESVRTIAESACMFTQFRSIALPEELQTIDDAAFYASNLSGDITLPGALTEIGFLSFANSEKIINIVLPENLQSLGEDAFASCEGMSTVTFLSDSCSFPDGRSTIFEKTVIHGHIDSTAWLHAKRYGYDFVDIDSGEHYQFGKGNDGYISLLPIDLESTAPAFCRVYSVTQNGNINGYQPNIVLETDTMNTTYLEMLTFVNDLIKDCTTDYERAKLISRWVTQNMTYSFGRFGSGETPEGVYKLWTNRNSNCEGYTQLTNFLLHLAGIPNATLTSYGHCWSAALIDGRWVMIDSTNGLFDYPSSSYESIIRIVFAVDNNMVCVIDDLTGVKLASYGVTIHDHADVSEITIPEYVTYIYNSVFKLEDAYGSLTTHLTIKGTAGSYAESYLRENLPHYNNYSYENGMFTAIVGEEPTRGDVDGDGKIDTVDAYFIVAHYNKVVTLTEEQLKAADVDGNGKVDTVDAYYIVAFYNKAIDALPAAK